MSRIPLPLAVDDVAAFARCLRSRLADTDHVPSHLELLNWLTRAAGYKNFQHFRAETGPYAERLTVSGTGFPEPASVDPVRLKRLVRLYDAAGRLIRWPSKRGMQLTCLWTLWATIPPRTVFTEPEITKILAAGNLFDDPVLLRRELCDMGLLWRTADCRAYRRLERRPPPEALALLRQLRQGAVGRSAAQ